MEIIILILLLIVIAALIWVIADRLRSGSRWREQSEALSKTVGERIADTTRVFGEVKESLGQLAERTRQIQEVGQNISSLHEILRAPKTRGGLGELFLERLLDDGLASPYYKLQYAFRNGEAVDAVVIIGDKLVPIDAKFPQESFERMVQTCSEEEQKSSRTEFCRAVKKHIDKVAKYIRPDEKTFDFALMYVPAENIYYETICQNDIYQSCIQKKVFLVSPNSFYAYLQVITLGLEGLHIENTAQEILGRLQRLKGDFTTLQKDYKVLGGHLSDASKKYEETSSRLTRFGERLEIAGGSSAEELSAGSHEIPKKNE